MSQTSRLRRSRRCAGLRPLVAVLLIGVGVTMSRGSDVLAAAGRLRPSAEAEAEAGAGAGAWAQAQAQAAARMTGDPRTHIAAPSRYRRATLAQLVVGVEARSGPGEGRGVWWAGTATSWSAEPQVLLVLRSVVRHGRLWLCVLLPIRPDGATGWIPRDNVTLLSTRYWITVDKRTRMVTIYRNGRRVHSYEAVIGKPATPTPDGLAAVYERDPQPDAGGFLGPWALSLTILSNVLENFGGGPGRVAIHGRAGASLQDPLGSARSHGCIRIDNSAIVWMAQHIPQGTPVQIVG